MTACPPAGRRSACTARASARGRARTCSGPAGCAALDALRVARALWIGSPAFSQLPRLMARGAMPSDDASAASTLRDLERDGPPPGAERLRFVLLSRRTDPVVLFSGLDLAWRRPEWLDRARVDARRDVPADARSTCSPRRTGRRPCPRRSPTTTGSRARPR